ncbi:hypothetical protein D1632_08710 [Chryseobacterium nematophagum]|uniref:Uncharacterized protein n=1 Tax=Chryseobacterium nematophagum TaxID=2305228 RepID=A0A3M7LC94_9FLAO|nr:hypothetical protein D1632_08710 [Chryseobacterium nematophagum]
MHKVLNQEISLNENQVKKNEKIIFSLDNQILHSSSNQLEKKYLNKINHKTYSFYPKNINLNKRQTILYKMFLNDFLISFNDYEGKYIITKYK